MTIGIARTSGGRQAAIVLAALFVGCCTWLAPNARADESQYEGFYTPPGVLSGNPGDVIREEPSRIVLEPSGQIDGWRASGTRIMYGSSP